MNFKQGGMVKSLWQRLQSPARSSRSTHLLLRTDHCISRQDISKSALKVLYRLSEAGFDAYLVGGSVRDLLLQRKPKDFDIATNATPEEVRHIFRNSRIIGRRFRLVHVYFHDEVIEVSTFRANAEENTAENNFDEGEDSRPAPMITADNTYGTIEEDAWRRDFTVNALYYNIKDFSVIDFTNGLVDLKRRCICMIGDPVQRFHEDPVRLLRAIRLAAKLEFSIDKSIRKPVTELSYLLDHVPQARLLDEIIKLFFEGHAVITFKMLQSMQYLPVLFPVLAELLEKPVKKSPKKLIYAALASTDKRFHNQQRLTPGFLLAVFLWPVLQDILALRLKEGMRFAAAFHSSMQETLKTQSEKCLITKRMKVMMLGAWALQYRLEKRRPVRIYHFLKHRYFRAAFDLLVLRAEVGEVDSALVKWWDQFQNATPHQRGIMLEQL